MRLNSTRMADLHASSSAGEVVQDIRLMERHVIPTEVVRGE